MALRHPAVQPLVLASVGHRHPCRGFLLRPRVAHQGLQPTPLAVGAPRGEAASRRRGKRRVIHNQVGSERS